MQDLLPKYLQLRFAFHITNVVIGSGQEATVLVWHEMRSINAICLASVECSRRYRGACGPLSFWPLGISDKFNLRSLQSDQITMGMHAVSK